MFQPSFRGMQLQKAQSQKRERSESFTAGSNIPDIRFQVPSSNFASHCVSRTLNTSPSRLVANCPHKCSSNQSHRLLLCTRFFSSQGHHAGIMAVSSFVSWRQPLSSVFFHTASNSFFSLDSERCLENRREMICVRRAKSLQWMFLSVQL